MSTHALGEGQDFDAVARRIVLASIQYLDEEQACPFCELGHVPEEVEMFSMHDEGCPLQGFERTVDVERLAAWASLRVGEDGGR